MKVEIIIDETDKAYIAGLFDGEGCIFIAKNKYQYKGNLKYNYQLGAILCNTISLPIDMVYKHYGGHKQVTMRSTKNRQNRTLYILNLRSKQAEIFLKSILPYLIIKKDQAILGIEFQEEIINKHKKFSILTAFAMEQRKHFYNKMKLLKVPM